MNLHPQALEPGHIARVFFNPTNLLTMERYFETREAIPPYKMNSVTSFMDLFKSPVRILKDIIRILSLDLSSSLPPGSPPLKWTLTLCLTQPPQGPQIFPPGYCSMYIKPTVDKILLTLQLNRVPPPASAGTPAPPEASLSSVCVPIYHEVSSNQTSYLQAQGQQPSSVTMAVASHLQRFNEQFRTNPPHMTANECSLFPSVKDLLLNLNLS